MQIARTKRIHGRRLRFVRAPAARVVFLHVPKCGGNSLRLALRDAWRAPFSGGSRWRVHVSPRGSRLAAERLGVSVADFRDALLRYHLQDGKSRLFTGHFSWPEGLLEEFPDVSLVTMLRDPVAHFLSCYYELREAGRSEQGLDAFLDGDSAGRIGTSFVRAFAGPVDAHELGKPHAIEAACSRLATVALIGLLEDLPGFVVDFRRRLGVRLRLPHANAGSLRQRAERAELTDRHRARIAERVAANQAVYDFARREVERRRARPDPN